MMRNICVIGGTSNIGEVICKSLSDSYNVDKTNSLTCDVRDEKKVIDYFQGIDSLYGLVYCSALKSEYDALDDPKELERLLLVNLFGAIYCLQEAAKKIKIGKIVVIGSVDGTFGNYKKTMYAVSKAALHEYTRCFASQVKDRIEAICLVPGTISSDNDKQAIANFVKCFMDNSITNIHAQLIRMDKGNHTFPL